jgi:hypothetical protein
VDRDHDLHVDGWLDTLALAVLARREHGGVVHLGRALVGGLFRLAANRIDPPDQAPLELVGTR